MKKIILTLCIMILVFSFNICYAQSSEEKFVAKFLINIGVLNGYPDGDLRLNNTITREEFSKLIVLASSFKDSIDLNSSSSPFVDVTKDRWSSPYVKVATQNGILQGYPDLTFRPENNIKLEEAAVIALRILNYTANDYGINWPYSQIKFAQDKHVLDGVNKKAGENITRGDAIKIIYSTLMSNINDTQAKYINLLDYTILEDVIIIASHDQDTLISNDSILTSKGLLNLKYPFDNETVGCKSVVVFNTDNEVLSIIPNDQNMKVYSVVSILGNQIIANDGGNIITLDVKNDTKAYYKSQELTLSQISKYVDSGKNIKVFYSNNVIDYVFLVESSFVGPYIVKTNNWMSEYSIPSNVNIIKDGAEINSSNVLTNDVIYYYSENNEVIVYDDKVSGMIEKFEPSQKNVSSILISDKSYSISNSQVYNKLQKYSEGNVVTLLLGKDLDVIEIVDPKETNSEVLGILVGVGTQNISNSDGSYSSNYIEVLNMNGDIERYIVKNDYSDDLNKVVKVMFGNSIIVTSSVNAKSIQGKVNANKNMIGNNSIAKNANIIEVVESSQVYSSKICNVTLNRIDGLSLSTNNIVGLTKNSNGEINNLIIKDVTNDMYDYGMLLSVVDTMMYNKKVIYTYMQDGLQLVGTSMNVLYNVKANNPIAVVNEKGNIIKMFQLERVSGLVKEVEIGKMIIGNKEYFLTSNVKVFKEINSNEYQVSNINEVIKSNKSNITVYYDKPELNGGMIRVIVIR